MLSGEGGRGGTPKKMLSEKTAPEKDRRLRFLTGKLGQGLSGETVSFLRVAVLHGVF